jgi:hypothetical protein
MASQLSTEIPGVTNPNVLYHYRLGVFHAMWGTIEILTDLSIGKFLKLPHAEAHMVLWGMMFGAKAKLLGALIKRSDHPKKQALMTALNAIRGDAKRDVVAHAYQFDGDGVVAFMERSRSTEFKARLHVFTHDEFRMHVDKLIGDGNTYQEALGIEPAEFDAFVNAVMKL